MTDEATFQTRIASADLTHIRVRNYDLTSELMGVRSFGAVVFLLIGGRLPEAAEQPLVEAILSSLVEHGLTPSAAVTRVTYSVAPESLQGAVAAGLLGAGSRVLGSMEECGRLLTRLEEGVAAGKSSDEEIERIVDEYRGQRRPIPGLGHVVHTEGDPRAGRLFQIAEASGRSGRHVERIQQLAVRAGERVGKRLPVNVTGAIAAVLLELGVPWELHRGFALVSRTAGLIAHVDEERRDPIAPQLRRLLRGAT
jgi:citrate synthase